MVSTLEGQYFLIANSVVALLVVQIHQRGNLWEGVSHMLQQVYGLFLTTSLVVVELDDDHQFTTGTIADNDVAQQSHLCTQVEERDAVLHSIVANVVTYLVVQVVHQPTLLNRQNLVESPCDMESNGRHILQTLTLVVRQCLNLFLGEIALVGAAEVQFVAILLRLYATKDRAELWQFHLAYAVQLVVHLLLLEFQLLFIGQILPLTTTTDTEVFAEGNCAYLTICNKAHHLALGKGVLLATNLYVTNIARYAEGDEDHQVLPVEQAFSLSGHSFYRYALKER